MKMSPYEKQLYTQFNLTPAQAKALAKKLKPSTKISAATTQVRQGPMKASEGKRTTLQQQAERSRTVSRLKNKTK